MHLGIMRVEQWAKSIKCPVPAVIEVWPNIQKAALDIMVSDLHNGVDDIQPMSMTPSQTPSHTTAYPSLIP